MNRLDFKGLNCPQPVMETKKYLDEHKAMEGLHVLVDNKAASENVSRFLSSRGFTTEVTGQDREYTINATLSGECNECEVLDLQPLEKSTLILFSHNTMGTGNKELGGKLMLSFIKTLGEIKDSLWRLVFVNEGVMLTVQGAETLSALQDLEKKGVSLLVCGTCLDYFNLLEKKQVGQTTNMLDIMTSLQVAGKVINF
ncbi:MAG: sulfurtransferase-like selenium metabolism protein YedF [Proteobacteria bacterium]|nr:sulfurtransferase-like selenium metabolism protein YedF [Pseudomonadota bacterium]